MYIKEAWATDPEDDKYPILYKSDFDWETESYFRQDGGKWCSPLFMPAWAARYFIKIIDLRPERLQEITEADAIAEGLNPDQIIPLTTAYALIWNKIYPKYPWKSNPWCFVSSFDKVK